MDGMVGFGPVKGVATGLMLLGLGASANAQDSANTKLKSVLLLDKSQFGANGHMESRRDLIAALRKLSTAKGFALDIIGQNDNTINTKFTDANLKNHQVVIFSNNDGVDEQITGNARAAFEKYVNEGGGFMPIHAASAFCEGWTWFDNALVQKFYGPHGNNQPSVDIQHDAEGTKTGTETAGIFKGLTPPLQFLDEYYAFQRNPRGGTGVSILVTIKESSSNKPLEGAMGADHPVIWAKTVGKGRVVHNSMGHSWSFNNVYTAKNEYLTNLLYGMLRYTAGDFIGCMDDGYEEFNPDATSSDQEACKTPIVVSISSNNVDSREVAFSKLLSNKSIQVDVHAQGHHQVALVDMAGKVVQNQEGNGPQSYSLQAPAKSGFYLIKVDAGGKRHSQRITIL